MTILKDERDWKYILEKLLLFFWGKNNGDRFARRFGIFPQSMNNYGWSCRKTLSEADQEIGKRLETGKLNRGGRKGIPGNRKSNLAVLA